MTEVKGNAGTGRPRYIFVGHIKKTYWLKAAIVTKESEDIVRIVANDPLYPSCDKQRDDR